MTGEFKKFKCKDCKHEKVCLWKDDFATNETINKIESRIENIDISHPIKVEIRCLFFDSKL